MATLLIELDAPMQSWGYRSRFSERDTALEPTKSGVLGLCAAALGLARTADLTELAMLRFAVRADREGTLRKEYQTAQQIINTRGGIEATKITNRWYLANARFVAALEGSTSTLLGLRDALLMPVYGIYLGMRAYVPARPVINADAPHLMQLAATEALSKYPLIAPVPEGGRVRIVRDALPGEESPTQDYRQDVPVSFAAKDYLPRKVITEWLIFNEQEVG